VHQTLVPRKSSPVEKPMQSSNKIGTKSGIAGPLVKQMPWEKKASNMSSAKSSTAVKGTSLFHVYLIHTKHQSKKNPSIAQVVEVSVLAAIAAIVALLVTTATNRKSNPRCHYSKPNTRLNKNKSPLHNLLQITAIPIAAITLKAKHLISMKKRMKMVMLLILHNLQSILQ
jgi:hypothetical protein